MFLGSYIDDYKQIKISSKTVTKFFLLSLWRWKRVGPREDLRLYKALVVEPVISRRGLDVVIISVSGSLLSPAKSGSVVLVGPIPPCRNPEGVSKERSSLSIKLFITKFTPFAFTLNCDTHSDIKII